MGTLKEIVMVGGKNICCSKDTSTVRAIKFVGKYQTLFKVFVFERQKFESKNAK
jgi:hypothetical protein